MEHLGSALEVKKLVSWCLTEIPGSEAKDGFLLPAMSSTFYYLFSCWFLKMYVPGIGKRGPGNIWKSNGCTTKVQRSRTTKLFRLLVSVPAFSPRKYIQGLKNLAPFSWQNHTFPSVLAMVSVAVVEHQDQKQTGKKRIYFLAQLSGNTLSLREVAEGRNLGAGTEAAAMSGLCLLGYSSQLVQTAFLNNLAPPSQRCHGPHGAGSSHINQEPRKMHYKFAYGQILRRHFLSSVSCFSSKSSCVKLTQNKPTHLPRVFTYGPSLKRLSPNKTILLFPWNP